MQEADSNLYRLDFTNMTVPTPGKFEFKSSFMPQSVGKVVAHPDEDAPILNGTGRQLMKPKLLWRLDRRGVDDGQICTPIDVGFLSKGILAVSELDNERIQLFDSKGKSILIIGEGEVRPRGLATDKIENNIAVIDDLNRTVHMFTCDGQDIGMWRKNMFSEPRGITVTSLDLFIITDVGKNKPRINIHEPDGKVVSSFGSDISGRDYLRFPGFVSVDQHDRIIVSDWESHKIKVFDIVGNLLLEFGEAGHGKGQMMYPNGVAVDYQDNILVADNGNHRVSLYSSSGQFIQHILTTDNHVTWPEGIALSDAGMLAVTEYGIDNDSVKVFQV